MPNRKFDAGGEYRYGFNGKENDNEVKGDGNQQDYGMRIYDPRIGRFLSVDPISKKFPMLTPYQFASNTPICAIDLDGLEAVSLSLRGDLFVGFVGREVGVGAAIGIDGIAWYTYDISNWGGGLIAGVGLTATFYPAMQSVSNIGGESLGMSISGGLIGRWGVGTTVSGDDFGFTSSYGLGGGARLSYDFGQTDINVVKWDEVVEFIKSKSEISTTIQKIFGISENQIENSVKIIQDYYKQISGALLNKRLQDITIEKSKLDKDIKVNEEWLDNYEKQGLFYKLLRYSDKKTNEVALKASKNKLAKIKKEEEIKSIEVD